MRRLAGAARLRLCPLALRVDRFLSWLVREEMLFYTYSWSSVDGEYWPHATRFRLLWRPTDVVRCRMWRALNALTRFASGPHPPVTDDVPF